MTDGLQARISDLEAQVSGLQAQINGVRRSNYILYGIVVAMLASIVAGFAYNSSRITDQAHAGCVIQARGLPAGHELASSMADIHELLIQPARPGAPPPPPAVAKIVHDLNSHLNTYLRIEAKQPATRRC